MPTKESRELYLVERFLPSLSEGETFAVSQPAPPLPDILIQTDGKKIGIELTALIIDEESRGREANQDFILNEAQRLFEARYNLPLLVTVAFSDAANWKGLNRKSIAELLADIVENTVSTIKDIALTKTEFNIRIESFIHSCIRSVSISYLDRLTIPCWSPITPFWVPDVPIEKIQEIISRKNKNVSGYLMDCNEVWLIILETGSPSSYFSDFDNLQDVTFISDFTRTMIGRIPTGDLLTLQTKPLV